MDDSSEANRSLVAFLSGVRILEDSVDGTALIEARSELAEYVHVHARAVARSLDLLRRHAHADRPLKVLELGAAPYYFTALMAREFDAAVTAANVQAATWPGADGGPRAGHVVLAVPTAEGTARLDVLVDIFNIEKDPFPYAAGTFDVVLCMEVLEHLAYSPSHMLAEAHRVLRPGGLFFLTVPNLLTIKRLVLMLLNRTTEVPYSGYGLYGRHQREFAPHEVAALLTACHYEVAALETANVWPTDRGGGVQRAVSRGLNRLTDLPVAWLAAKREYILCAARPVGEPVAAYPAWLYSHRHLYPEPPHGVRKVLVD